MIVMPRNPRYDQFKRALLEARQANNLTQQEVASRLGKPQSYISKYESGERRLDVVEFLAVCEALEVKPMAILKRLGIDDDEEDIHS
ncbi:helix-turn-helix transcriptional regulator [Laribacter hongkongensis]|uniref:helix-turn-helix domain-containing protein n=1 Tax=Laribacter hongkongensis TaxID=168471 RepID=UPI001EFD4B32|nr:helix-turn-helix transcriptional regulator [Laribacter hongkongensis]MCG9106348.1 helix-turn-helix transcriptional regulator [Laribacter hongkongensis]